MVVATLSASLQPRAQTTQAANQNRTVTVNYVYAADLGFGGYAIAGLSADVYTLPLTGTLHDVPQDGWALRLLLPMQLGIYDFGATDTDGQRIAINQQSVSVVPGAELQIPVGDHVMLKPFAQFGIAHAFGVGGLNV